MSVNGGNRDRHLADEGGHGPRFIEVRHRVAPEVTQEPEYSTPVLLGITPRIGFAYQSEAAAMIFSKRRRCEPAQ